MAASVYPSASHHTRRDLLIGFVVSLCVFFVAPWLSQRLKEGPPKAKPAEVIPHIEMVMPKVEPEEEVVDDTQAQTAPADIAPPMQTDVPQIVTETSFVQKLEPPPPEGMQVNRGLLSVPANIGFGKNSQIFDTSMLDQQPVATFQSHPVYPYDMKKQGISGRVLIEFLLYPDGNVHSAFAVSSTQHEFEASAIAAVMKWRYKPGRRGGKAVITRMQVPIDFTLSNDD